MTDTLVVMDPQVGAAGLDPGGTMELAAARELVRRA